MCNSIYPAKALVVIKSKYDEHYWVIRSDRKVEKLSPRELAEKFSQCVNYPELTYCPNNGAIIVWSSKGLSGLGFIYTELNDDVWCNIKRLAKLLENRLPEPITDDNIENARKEIEWLANIVISEGEALTV